jgi:hypothetical protein
VRPYRLLSRILGGSLEERREGKRTDGVFLGWWEREVAFGEAVGIFLVGVNEVLLDWGRHCDCCLLDLLKYLVYSGNVGVARELCCDYFLKCKFR